MRLMLYLPGSRRSIGTTPLSDEVTGGNAGARAPSSRPLIVTVAPGTTAFEASTTVTMRRPSCGVWAKTEAEVAAATQTTAALSIRQGIAAGCQREDDGTMNSVIIPFL